MRKIIAFMHISLDGFVAGINGEMNWRLNGLKVDALDFKFNIQQIISV